MLQYSNATIELNEDGSIKSVNSVAFNPSINILELLNEEEVADYHAKSQEARKKWKASRVEKKQQEAQYSREYSFGFDGDEYLVTRTNTITLSVRLYRDRPPYATWRGIDAIKKLISMNYSELTGLVEQYSDENITYNTKNELTILPNSKNLESDPIALSSLYPKIANEFVGSIAFMNKVRLLSFVELQPNPWKAIAEQALHWCHNLTSLLFEIVSDYELIVRSSRLIVNVTKKTVMLDGKYIEDIYTYEKAIAFAVSKIETELNPIPME